VAIVADNAANLQAAIKIVATKGDATGTLDAVAADVLLDALLELEGINERWDRGDEAITYRAGDVIAIIPQRCVAHALQLVVKDILSSPEYAEFVEAYERCKHLSNVKECETRWNSKFRVLEDLVKRAGVATVDKHRLETLRVDLEPFNKATNLVQSDHATVWEQLGAIQLLLQHFIDQSPQHECARQTLVRRAGFVVSPAAFLVAYTSPNLNRRTVQASAAAVGTQWHAKCVSDESFASAFDSNRVPPQPRAISREEWKKLKPTKPGLIPPMEHSALMPKLVNIAPTEAAVERMFSWLKRSLPAQRASCGATAATSHVLLNACEYFMNPLSMKPPNPSPLISPATMAWIVNNAAAHLPLVETAPDDEVLDRCGGCQGTHEEGDADDTIDWWMCSKCGQWYAVECLGLGQEQVQAIRADNNTKWACDNTQYCHSLPKDYVCARFLAEDARQKEQARGGRAKRRRN
jgi:hypothetical protein